MDIYHYATATLTSGANSFLFGWWLCAVLLHAAPTPRRRYVVAVLASAIVSVAAMELAKSRVIWPLHPTFPSAHEAFAAVMVVSLWYAKRAWGAMASGVSVLLGCGLVIHRAHQPIDLLGGFVVGMIAALAALAMCRLKPATVLH